MAKILSKAKEFDEVEASKMQVLELCKDNPTRNEIVFETGLSKGKVQHIVNALIFYGVIKAEKSFKVCRVSKRKMKRFKLTGVPYVPFSYAKLAEERKKRPKIKDLPLEEQIAHKKEVELRRKLEAGTNTVIKVNEHTTVYMNSKKKAGAYNWQSKTGARKGMPIALQSGMAMFSNW